MPSVLIGRRRHAAEGIVEIQLSCGIAEIEQGPCNCKHATAAPHTALHERAREFPSMDVADRQNQRLKPVVRSHCVRLRQLDGCYIVWTQFWCKGRSLLGALSEECSQ
jgi:hypothetical protein